MVLLISPLEGQRKLAEYIRARRLQLQLTQQGVAVRSGVPLATLRKFEQKGSISLEGFLKILMVVGGLEEVVSAAQPIQTSFSSIDEVLRSSSTPDRKRGCRS